MRALVKICGLNSAEAVRAAADADFAGFIFYPPSPRYVEPAEAAALAAKLPKQVRRVAVFVDPDDGTLARTLDVLHADIIQLHGHETPARVAAIKRRFGLPVIKAIPISAAADFKAAAAYADSADWLMFDAKPPKRKNSLPGGNAVSFDWRLLRGKSFPLPWLLSGGLDAANVAQAVRVSGAPAVDVSSGVETRPGQKNPFRIREFVRATRTP
jgi:phosphoribosylanthranilate isomerase